jgi:Protein-L-isoaspartate(D-aspartate) O-methyltransferase (PCMT)
MHRIHKPPENSFILGHAKNIPTVIHILRVTFPQCSRLYFYNKERGLEPIMRRFARITSRRHWCFLVVIAAAACCGGILSRAVAQSVPDYAALPAAPDRSEADRDADKRRDPAPFLAFAAPRPGMKVLDMGAGAGYSSELMARAVAPNGMVFAQNPADLGERAKAAFAARLAMPAMKNATADIAPFDDPISPRRGGFRPHHVPVLLP